MSQERNERKCYGLFFSSNTRTYSHKQMNAYTHTYMHTNSWRWIRLFVKSMNDMLIDLCQVFHWMHKWCPTHVQTSMSCYECFELILSFYLWTWTHKLYVKLSYSLERLEFSEEKLNPFLKFAFKLKEKLNFSWVHHFWLR